MPRPLTPSASQTTGQVYKRRRCGRSGIIEERGLPSVRKGKGVRAGRRGIHRGVAEADERYMTALERQERFGSGADSETVLLFAEDVKEARTEFLLALEAAYRQ